jgi:hypothetical protein
LASGRHERFNWYIGNDTRLIKGSTTMSMIDRYRHRRQAVRQERAIQRALSATRSRAVREEILAAAQRYYG